MGVTNFDNLPQNIVPTRLREAQQTVAELKGSLQVTTGNNLRFYTLDNGTGFVWTGTVSWSSPPPVFRVTLTSQTAESFICDVATQLYSSADGGASWTRILPTNDYTVPTIEQYDINGGVFTPHQSVWRVAIYGNAYFVGFKIQVMSTDKVTMSIVKVG